MKRSVRQVVSRGSMVLFLLGACASIPEVKVNYRLQEESKALEGQKIYLDFRDTRKDRELLGPGAKEELGMFTGNFSFSVARPGERGFKIGPYDITGMLQEAFRRKLVHLGARVEPAPGPDVTEVRITLQEFKLDLADRRWIASMKLEGGVVQEGKVVSAQTIEGRSERVKILGTKGADEALGELFTDMINRLDVARLIRRAGER
ncbi:MAG: hypothetical protein JRH05_10675 [Deltaproteobacteria bacterium]|nr:hypothetical protein [Deltaproteobacteria bacterium]